MAVHAQYPSSVLMLNRSEQERKEMEFPQAAHGFMDKSALLFAGGAAAGTAGNGNPRKRAWEAVSGMPTASQQHKNGQPINVFSTQPPLTLVSLDQLQNHPQPPAIVSTGLRLSFDDQNHHLGRNTSNPMISSSSSASSSALFSSILLSEELSAQINQQKDEIEQFIRLQGEQLRRALAERRQRHYRVLLSAVEESAARRLREKDTELERATRRSVELEDRLARLRAESMAWQTKAAGYQATAASLHAQLQQAAAAPSMHTRVDNCGESLPAEDAESAYIDPDRMDPEPASCRACRRGPATVVLLPCRHLCLCDACDAEAVSGGGGLAQLCPICCCVRTGSVRVFLS